MYQTSVFKTNHQNFLDNGKQLTKQDWDKIKYNCIESTLHAVLPVQLIPIWYKCATNLDKFCVNISWVEMKGCMIESIFEQRIYYIQLWYKDRLAEVLQNLLQIKSCIRRYTGGLIINKQSKFFASKSNQT